MLVILLSGLVYIVATFFSLLGKRQVPPFSVVSKGHSVLEGHRDWGGELVLEQ